MHQNLKDDGDLKITNNIFDAINSKSVQTPEEFLKRYHNDRPNDWLYEKRDVVARLIKEYTEKALRIHVVSGSLLLQELLQLANNKNEDGIPVIKYLNKPNGGQVAYVRYDAMVKKLNDLLKQ